MPARAASLRRGPRRRASRGRAGSEVGLTILALEGTVLDLEITVVDESPFEPEIRLHDPAGIRVRAPHPVAGQGLRVLYREFRPDPSCPLLAVPSKPVIFLAVPRLDGPVAFSRTVVISPPCR